MTSLFREIASLFLAQNSLFGWPAITEQGYKIVFRNFPTAPTIVSDALADQKEVFAIAGAAPKTVVFMHVNDTFGTAVYFFELFVKSGGLISYGPDNADLVRRAAVYVDRILKGEKTEDLPVQLPTKFELAINNKAAAALGVKFPPSIIATADDVIE